MSLVTRSAAIVLLTSIATSCATYRAGPLSEQQQIALPASQGPAVTYNVEYHYNENRRGEGDENWRKRFTEELNEAGYFTSLQEQSRPGFEGIHLDIDVHEEGNLAAASISGYISGFTFGLFPGFAHAKMRFDIQEFRDGQEARKFSYEDAYNLIIWLPLLPATPFFTTEKAAQGMTEDAVGSFLRDYDAGET